MLVVVVWEIIGPKDDVELDNRGLFDVELVDMELFDVDLVRLQLKSQSCSDIIYENAIIISRNII